MENKKELTDKEKDAVEKAIKKGVLQSDTGIYRLHETVTKLEVIMLLDRAGMLD